MQALSQFVGQACRRYERMDTSAICQYLANTLKAAQSFDLLVLKALVSDMTVSHCFHKVIIQTHASTPNLFFLLFRSGFRES